jgi:NCS2 family nucleobase:cation symporter-2
VHKPANILYTVDEVPPLGVTLMSGLQQVGLISVFLLFPLLVGREANLTDAQQINLLSISMVGLAVAAVLPALRIGPVGAGYLAPAVFTAVYLGPSLLAAKVGGLPLVLGMTVFAGSVGIALSAAMRRLRSFFPPEIAGLVVILIGIKTGTIGVRYMLGIDTSGPSSLAELAVPMGSLATMIGFSIWARGYPKLFCALIGMCVGYAIAALIGTLGGVEIGRISASPLLGVPSIGQFGWAFDYSLAPAFTVAALAACLRTVGNLTTCQKINDADWVRPDMRQIGNGVLADALTTVSAGLLGTMGMNSSPSAIGLSTATGVTSRRVAYAIAAIFLALSLFPKAAATLTVMPRPVMGAMLVFAASSVLVSGLEIINLRLLDSRRTYVIGLSLMLGLAVDFFPGYFASLPERLHPLTDSSLALGMLSAIALNMLFRIGVRRTQRLIVDPEEVEASNIERFMTSRGATWGARRDVIERATFNLEQSVETLASSGIAAGPLEIEVSFDEFTLDIRVSYEGLPLELAQKRPSNEEIMASEEGERKLAGFMLQRLADRVSVSQKGDRSTIHFHFDH